MADVITAEDAGRLLTLVAPGYFAYVAYTQRFPRRPRDEFPTLVASVAFSLPLVALANELARKWAIVTNPAEVPYVALLLGLSGAVGYVVALVRGAGSFRALLSALGHSQEPELSVVSRTVMRLPSRKDWVIVGF